MISIESAQQIIDALPQYHVIHSTLKRIDGRPLIAELRLSLPGKKIYVVTLHGDIQRVFTYLADAVDFFNRMVTDDTYRPV